MQGQQGVLEYRESVNLSDRKMDRKSGGWNQPSAVSGWGYGTITIEKSQGHVLETSEEF
jgi:hypothetical protein